MTVAKIWNWIFRNCLNVAYECFVGAFTSGTWNYWFRQKLPKIAKNIYNLASVTFYSHYFLIEQTQNGLFALLCASYSFKICLIIVASYITRSGEKECWISFEPKQILLSMVLRDVTHITCHFFFPLFTYYVRLTYIYR